MLDSIVIGGGFAGLSAAVWLAARGARVLVLEARPTLGGRATSYLDRTTGELVDNGQHVLFGCYRETRGFLQTIGAADHLHFQPALDVSYVDHDTRSLRLTCPPLLPPLHLVAGILDWGGISARERWSGLRMVAPVLRARCAAQGSGANGTRATETVREWLVRHGQGRRLRELLWEPLALAALNQAPEHAAAAPFARVLGELCGPNPSDAAVGIPAQPLSRFYADPARRFIASHGGDVRTMAPAKISPTGSRLDVVTRGERLTARTIIAAVPWYAFARLFVDPSPSLAPTIAAAMQMQAEPIATVNLWFDRPVLDRPFVGLIGRTMHWVFDKGLAFGRDRSHLALVSSGARGLMHLSNASLIELAVSDLRSALPQTRDLCVRHATATRDRQATFSLAPPQPQRPRTETEIAGLFLAGDWIETGLPGTIESAVLSGHLAAGRALDALAA